MPNLSLRPRKWEGENFSRPPFLKGVNNVETIALKTKSSEHKAVVLKIIYLYNMSHHFDFFFSSVPTNNMCHMHYFLKSPKIGPERHRLCKPLLQFKLLQSLLCNFIVHIKDSLRSMVLALGAMILTLLTTFQKCRQKNWFFFYDF